MSKKAKRDVSNGELLTELRIEFAKLQESIKADMRVFDERNTADHRVIKTDMDYVKKEVKICNDELGRAEARITKIEKSAFKMGLFWKFVLPFISAVGGAALANIDRIIQAIKLLLGIP